MMQVSFISYFVAGAALSMAYYTVFFLSVAIVALVKEILVRAERSAVKPAERVMRGGFLRPAAAPASASASGSGELTGRGGPSRILGMITVTEPIIWGDEHVPVNTGLLETVVRAFPGERVRFWGEAGHIALIRALINPEDGARVEFIETRLPPRGADFKARLRHDLSFIGRLLDEAAGSHLILASSCPSLITALKLRGLRTAVRDVHIVLHGNLTVLWSWRSRNPLVRLTDLRTAMGLPSRLPVRYFVMEPAIRGELLATLPGLNRLGRAAAAPSGQLGRGGAGGLRGVGIAGADRLHGGRIR